MPSTIPPRCDEFPRSFIKGVAFELPENFKYDHSPSEEDDIFFGREEEKDKFLSILKNSKRKKGVYLVSGYRGMGKTSFVEKVISEYRDNIQNNEVVKIGLHISSPNIKEIDILRQITTQLRNELKKRSKIYDDITKARKNVYSSINTSLLLVLILWIIPIIVHNTGLLQIEDILALSKNTLLCKYCMTVLIIALLCLPFACIVPLINNLLKTTSLNKQSENDPYYMAENLYRRAYSAVTKENSTEIAVSENKLLGKIDLYKNKETHDFPLASSKELEQEIINILQKVNDLQDKEDDGCVEKRRKENIRTSIFKAKDGTRGRVNTPEFIFVFDELDKVSLEQDQGGMYEDLESFQHRKDKVSFNVDENRSRKGIIINILGNLKSFLTQANARFIFIAGREMYDAALADISDRQSLLSSIFSHIFYINSFLKDIPGDGFEGQYGITDTIERYLIHNLTYDRNVRTLKEFHDKNIKTNCHNSDNEDYHAYAERKALFILQKLIVYLTYRSNGSPKKLSKAFESFIVIRDIANTKKIDPFWTHNIIIEQPNSSASERKYLFLDYYDQYRIGFINYLFRPFIINQSDNLKRLSDSTLVTTPYVMDHLIKFHPFAFSINNLEQIPEVISTSSTQAFRNYVKSLVEYLSLNHIRETHVNLFSYKFISQSETELNFITLKFEEESAAVNFTLDESFPVKLYIRRKIKELRSIFLKTESENKQVYSISFLNGWLGDLDFFDQQYDDAIVAYSDAIKEITNRNFKALNYRDFSLLINFKLKQGICFEKMKSYHEAISFYTDAINNTKGFLDYNLSEDKSHYNNYSTSAVNDLLQVVNQSFIAKAYTQEKMSFSGFGAYKAQHNLEGLLELVYKLNDNISGNHYLTLANYFLNIGNLVYYKNVHISRDEIKDIVLKNTPLFSAEKLNEILYRWGAFDNVKNKTSPSFAILYYLLALICLKRYNSYDNVAERKFIEYYRDKDFQERHRNTTNVSMPTDIAYFKDEGYLSHILHTISNNKCNNRYAKKIFAILLSNIGNALLQLIAQDNNNHSNTGLTIALTNTFNSDISKWVGYNNYFSWQANLELVFNLYKWSSEAYEAAGVKISQHFQLKKMLYIIRASCSNDKNMQLINCIKEKLIQPLYGLNSEISDVSDKKQYQKYKRTLGLLPYNKTPDKNGDIVAGDSLNNDAKDHLDFSLSNHPEDRELRLLLTDITMSIDESTAMNEDKFTNPYNSIATQYGRIGSLLSEEKRYWIRLERLKPYHTTILYFYNTPYVTKCITKCIINYLFSCISIIRISNSLKTNAMISDSLIGFIYYKMGECSRVFINDANRDTILNRLNDYLGIHHFILNDPYYLYRKAKLHFERAESLHNQGKAYENIMNEKVYLEDDFNDNSNHFGIALERLFLYSDKISRRLKEIDTQLENDPHRIK